MPIDFEDILNPDNYVWPKKGDRLLRQTNDFDRGFDFGGDTISRHVFIGDGHMLAGARLIESCGDRWQDQRLLIYPILSCYRQGLELGMKWVIAMYGSYADVSLSTDDQDHNLWALWKLCREVIEYTCGAGSDEEATTIVEQIIKDFHDLDTSAQAFRYPANKKGKSFKLPQGLYDLNGLKDSMEKLDNYFSGVDGMLSDLATSVDY